MPEEIKSFNGMEFKDIKKSNDLIIQTYEGISTKIVIPNEYKDQKIICVGKKAFFSQHDLQTVIFEENTNIKNIEKKAFRNCHNLINFEVPDGILVIAKKTFLDCESLLNLKLPNSLVTIEKQAFKNCSSIQTINLPENLETIESRAFENCHSLFEVTIPSSVKKIAPDAFKNCRKLVHITNLSSVSIKAPYNNCEIRTSVDVEFKNTITIDENNFVIYKADGNDSILAYVGNDLTLDVTQYENIPFYPYAFNHCANITKAILPRTLTNIEDGLFWQCGNLMEIDLSPSVKKIGKQAFCGCKNLLKFNFYSSLNEIGEKAFLGCDNLKTIYVENGKLPTKIGIGNEKITLSKTKLELDSSRIIKQIDDRINYNKKEYFREYTDYSGRMAIRQKLDFDAVINLFNPEKQQLVIKNTTKELKETGVGIETDTYKNGLVVVKTYDENGNLIMEARTYDKKGIAKVFDISNHIVEERHDYSTIVIKEQTDKNGLVYDFIDENTYQIAGYIGKDDTVIIPDSFNGKPVIKIDDYAFFSNDYVKNITIPNSIKSIGNYVFNSCFGIEEITIPDSISTISYGLFFNCKNLKTIKFEGTIKEVKPFSFANCSNLTKPQFPSETIISPTAF